MKKIFKQGLKFIGVSGVGWIIDFIIYNALIFFFEININVANIISSLVGVSFVFIVSTDSIFESNSKISIKIKYIIYIVYQITLILLASYVMLIIKQYLINFDINLINKYVDVIVKILITPFTMLINFVVTKNLIEKI